MSTSIIVLCVAIIVGYRSISYNSAGAKSDDNSATNLLFEDVHLIRTITKRDISIDVYGNYVDVEFLADGRLVLADIANSNLFLLNEDFSRHSELKVEGKPSGISIDMSCNDIYMYVTCDQGFILRCRLQNDKWTMKKINKYIWARDVSGVVNNTVILTKYNKIIFYDLSKKKVLKTIQKKIGYNYIDLSADKTTFVYTEGDEVIGRDMRDDNKVNFRYRHELLDTPRGICMDHQNNVYVVGQLHNNIHQISSDGKMSRVLIDDLRNITSPYGIAFHPKRNLFVVTSDDDEDVLMEVYEFQNK